MGLRAVTLGHALPSVVEAAEAEQLAARLELRTAPRRLELDAAESLPRSSCYGAEMVKFTKDGSTANTAAVKLARAWTGRDLRRDVCVDHPFFSYDDWAMVVHASSRRVSRQAPLSTQ